MDRKTEIILATLELAAKHGLGAVSLSQIADRLGIKKPSLYNHFKSKEELVTAMYQYLRQQAQEHSSATQVDYGSLVKDLSLEEALMKAYHSYDHLVCDEQMLQFFKVIYSERATNPIAAQILLEETDRMITATKNLFYALAAHKKMVSDDLDSAAVSYAMTVHAMIDYQMDCMIAGRQPQPQMVQKYITWFSKQLGGNL